MSVCGGGGERWLCFLFCVLVVLFVWRVWFLYAVVVSVCGLRCGGPLTTHMRDRHEHVPFSLFFSPLCPQPPLGGTIRKGVAAAGCVYCGHRRMAIGCLVTCGRERQPRRLRELSFSYCSFYSFFVLKIEIFKSHILLVEVEDLTAPHQQVGTAAPPASRSRRWCLSCPAIAAKAVITVESDPPPPVSFFGY